MRVLVACEFSGIVRDAFRALGHDAISCDLRPSEKPGPHIQGNVLDHLNDGWDLMIAHPPCQFLAVSGYHWNKRRPERAAESEKALIFVQKLMAAPIKKKAIENPRSIISTRIRKPDQVIQPWQFGHDASKTTCLWLYELDPLEESEIIPPRLVCCGEVIESGDKYGCPFCEGENVARPRWANQTNSGQNRLSPGPDRWKERSRTYQGIANAMAKQWGG